MRELINTLHAWQEEGQAVGRAVVVRTFGSAPRPEGAVLLGAADGRLAGSVSGGCVEGAAYEQIERARADGHARVIRYGISDEQAWDVGLACGGTIDVLVQPVVAGAVTTAAGDLEHGSAVLTELPADAPPPTFGPHEPGPGAPPTAPLVVSEEGHLDGTTGDLALDAELIRAAGDALARGTSLTVALHDRQWFVEAFPLRPRLVVVGAVQVAIPLVRMAREVGFETVVVDGRAAFATAERFPDVDRLVVGWPDEIADEIGLGPADSVAVLSHDVKFDEPAIVEALRRGCRYVGAVGSRKTQADRRTRLLAAGISRSELGRLHGPIGLDLGGRTPPETALAILAEIVAARHGGTGTPMHEHAMSATADEGAAADAETRLGTESAEDAARRTDGRHRERPARRPKPAGQSTTSRSS
jgi:xanthine dehydrogenase accessory factor